MTGPGYGSTSPVLANQTAAVKVTTLNDTVMRLGQALAETDESLNGIRSRLFGYEPDRQSSGSNEPAPPDMNFWLNLFAERAEEMAAKAAYVRDRIGT